MSREGRGDKAMNTLAAMVEIKALKEEKYQIVLSALILYDEYSQGNSFQLSCLFVSSCTRRILFIKKKKKTCVF